MINLILRYFACINPAKISVYTLVRPLHAAIRHNSAIQSNVNMYASHRSLGRTLIWALAVTVLVNAHRAAAQDPLIKNVERRPIRKSVEIGVSEKIESELSADELHVYRLQLASNQYVHAVVDQKSIDVAVEVLEPGGHEILVLDSPGGTKEPEQVHFISRDAGVYTLAIRSSRADAKPGRYTISTEELRYATQSDAERVEGFRLFEEAERLRAKMTRDALRSALPKYRESRTHFRAAGDARLEMTAILCIGATHMRIGEPDNASAAFLEALPLAEKNRDQQLLAITLNNIAALHYGRGEYDEALPYFKRASALAEAAGDKTQRASTLNNLAGVLLATGHLQEALDSFEQVLTLFRDLKDTRNEAVALHNLGGVYDEVGDKQRAADEYLSRAARIFRDLGDAREGQVLTGIGKIQGELGNDTEAIRALDSALQLHRTTGNSHFEAVTLNNLAAIFRRQGKYEEALEYLNQAMNVHARLEDRPQQAYTTNNIGMTYFAMGNSVAALDLLNRALSLQREIRDTVGQLSTHYNIANIELIRGNLTEARSHAEEAVALSEFRRKDLRSPDWRMTSFAPLRSCYELLIEILMRLDRAHPNQGYDALALRISESARARTLLETLGEAALNVRRGVDPAVLKRLSTLQRNLSSAASAQMKLLQRQHTEDEAKRVDNTVSGIIAEMRTVEAEIRKTSPAYAALTQPVPLSLDDLRNEVLDPETLLLEYSLGVNRSYLWAVTRTSIKTYELPGRNAIEDVARRMYASLIETGRRPAGETPKERALRLARANRDYRDTSRTLTGMVLAQAASELQGRTLLIVAEGALQYIPFGALPSPAGLRKESQDEPLMLSHDIVSLPSASTLAVIRRLNKSRPPTDRIAAVIADPVFSANDPRLKGNSAPAALNNGASDLLRSVVESGATDGPGIPRLAMTRLEAEAIAAYLPAARFRQFLDFQATKAVAADPELSRYRYLHIATHALVNNVHPELSGVIFSLVDEQGRPQDGFLRLYDVYNLDLPAELVVLSACETAIGKDVKGEGLMALARGFIHAGGARVVASLWKTDDRATSQLMKRFYEGVLGPRRLRPAQALREAEAEMWKSEHWRSPYYWGAFVLNGEYK